MYFVLLCRGGVRLIDIFNKFGKRTLIWSGSHCYIKTVEISVPYAAADETSKPRNSSLPQFWTDKQYVKFREEDDWLFFNNGKLGLPLTRLLINKINKIGSNTTSGMSSSLSPMGMAGKLNDTEIQKLNNRHHFGTKFT